MSIFHTSFPQLLGICVLSAMLASCSGDWLKVTKEPSEPSEPTLIPPGTTEEDHPPQPTIEDRLTTLEAENSQLRDQLAKLESSTQEKLTAFSATSASSAVLFTLEDVGSGVRAVESKLGLHLLVKLTQIEAIASTKAFQVELSFINPYQIKLNGLSFQAELLAQDSEDAQENLEQEIPAAEKEHRIILPPGGTASIRFNLTKPSEVEVVDALLIRGLSIRSFGG